MKAAEITEITETTGTTTSSCGRHPFIGGFRLFRVSVKFPAAASRFCSPAVRRRSFFLLLRRTPVRVGGIANRDPFPGYPLRGRRGILASVTFNADSPYAQVRHSAAGSGTAQ